MELQEFAGVQLYSQLGYSAAAPSILDRQGATMSALQEHLQLTDFTLNPTAVEVGTDDGQDRFRIGIYQTFASLMKFNHEDEALSTTRDFFSMAIEHMDRPAIAGVNIRVQRIAPVDSFEELRDALATSLTQDMNELQNAVGIPLQDVGWSYDFDGDGLVAKVAFGPMRPSQLLEILGAGNEDDFPPTFLFLRVDASMQNSGDRDSDPIKLWEGAAERVSRLADRLGGWIKGQIE